MATPPDGFAKLPIWTVGPKNTPYRDAVKNLRPASYAGQLGYASAGATAHFIVYHCSLMVSALFGSLPVAFVYSFFVEYYVFGMTGPVKE